MVRADNGWLSDTMPEAPLVGTHGRAWPMIAPDGKGPAYVGGWMIEAPGAHPLWHSYLLTVVHLRAMEGVPDPLLTRPDATHEIVVQALQADYPRAPQLTLDAPWRVLTPVNYAGQFVSADDATAASRGLNAVEMVIDGRLSPDSDFIRQWESLFGATMRQPYGL